MNIKNQFFKNIKFTFFLNKLFDNPYILIIFPISKKKIK